MTIMHLTETSSVVLPSVLSAVQDTGAVSAGSASVTPCGTELPATVPWTRARAWPATSRSATAGDAAIAASASATTPNSRARRAKRVPPVLQSALNTSKE